MEPEEHDKKSCLSSAMLSAARESTRTCYDEDTAVHLLVAVGDGKSL
jgi:hypothetical protein